MPITTPNTNPTTPTTQNDAVAIDLRAPQQLLAGIPQLLGFRPDNSVVVIAHTRVRGDPGDETRDTARPVLRGDLPPPGQEHELAEALCTPLLGAGIATVTLAIVGQSPSPSRRPGRPPCAELVHVLRTAFSDAGIRVAHALWVTELGEGASWGCYDDADCGGSLPDPGATTLAAESVRRGLVTYGSREALARRLVPDEPDVLARRAALLSDSVDELTDTADHRAGVVRGLTAVRSALERVALEDMEFADREVVELSMAIGLAEIRDACLALAVPTGTRRAAIAERLWLVLTCALPAPERAEYASLLAYSAYVRGDGALANLAIERAQEARPGHELAELLALGLRHGLTPDQIGALARTCDPSGLENAEIEEPDTGEAAGSDVSPVSRPAGPG